MQLDDNFHESQYAKFQFPDIDFKMMKMTSKSPLAASVSHLPPLNRRVNSTQYLVSQRPHSVGHRSPISCTQIPPLAGVNNIPATMQETRELSSSENQNQHESNEDQSSEAHHKTQEKRELSSSANRSHHKSTKKESPEAHHKTQGKRVLNSPTVETGRGRSKMNRKITHGYHSVEGKLPHSIEDYVFAQFKQIDDNELGLFAVFDGHSGREVPDYLRSHLFDNIIHEPDFWTELEEAIKRAYEFTDSTIMNKESKKRKGGSTAVTAILINCGTLVVANVGDSRAVLCQDGVAKQLSVDHEPNKERKVIEEKGGFVTEFAGDCPRVDGNLAMSRAFGDRSLKEHISSEPDVWVGDVDDDTEFLILASDGVWKVMSNQEAVDCVKDVEDPRSAAKQLIKEALERKSKDDISCIVVRFQ